MRQIRLMMGMPITVEISDSDATSAALNRVFDYFQTVDDRFSTYKAGSEISRINAGTLRLEDASDDMRLIFDLAEQTRRQAYGFFDIRRNGMIDPSGIVKGWAIREAASLLRREGFANYYVDAGGDVQMAGHNAGGGPWRVGIRSPFNLREVVRVVALTGCGIATSGSYARGQHIYNPLAPTAPLDDIVSLTVIGPDVYEADRFATAAFAMGRAGIYFVETLDGFEGYQIDSKGIATMTTGFKRFVPTAQMADGR